MTRNLKALGLALVAMLAIGAMSASAASATDFFTTTKEKAWLTGTSHDNVFEITGPKVNVKCTTSKFTATVENGKKEATALASYTGEENATPHETRCSGIGTPTIDMNDCHYKLTGNTTQSDEGKADAVVWIECPEGQKIQITTTLGATITIGSQTSTTGGVTYEKLPNHSAAGSAVKVTATVTGITYECETKFLCSLAGISTEGNDADYTGHVTVTGYEHNGGTMTAPTEGNPIPIEYSEG